MKVVRRNKSKIISDKIWIFARKTENTMFKDQNANVKMQNLKFNIQYSLFNIRYSFLILSSLLFGSTVLFAQLNAGPDVTINPGVPVTLTAKYGEDLIAIPVTLKDDDITSTPNAIGFSFNFYGNIYQDFFIGSNGWISFDYNTLWARGNPAYHIPSSATDCPKNCIFGPMQDYDPSLSQSPYIYYKTIGTTPSRKLVVMWCQTPIKWCTNDVVTFQIILNEGDNTIENHVFSKPLCTNPGNDKATLGIQDKDGINFKEIINYNYTPFALSQQAWKYVPVPNVVDRYTVDPITFQLLPITPGDKISYFWYEGTSKETFSTEKSIVVTPNETTTYTVFCTICNGATFDTTVTVTVVPKIPDAFTPNGDGLNDTFKIIGLPASSITKFNIKIYNRWGQMVFTSNDIEESWDGTMNNNGVDLCPDGAYAWVIYYENANKTKVTNKGSVILLR